jgi:hypothetical protein
VARQSLRYIESVEHISEDDLERYAMQRIPGTESGPLEEHLLICLECQDRIQSEIDFVVAMRSAAANSRAQRAL